MSWMQRAADVQDEIGWTDVNDVEAMGRATLELARLVKDMARELDRLTLADVEVGGKSNG